MVIRTPEGVRFELLLAGPISRMLAFSIDFLAIMAAGTFLQQVLSFFRIFGEDAFQAVVAVLYFAVSILYGMVTEWIWRGQTIGKRLLGLRVVEASGLRLKPAQIVVRNLLRAVDFLPALYLVGGAACVLNKRRQRLGDIAAGTIVIRTPKLTAPDVEQLLANKFNSLAEHRHLAARLRQKAPAHVAPLALEAILRRDELQPAARLDLFRELAEYFRKLALYPPEVTEQLSDEQYVRNSVDVLFQRNRSDRAG